MTYVYKTLLFVLFLLVNNNIAKSQNQDDEVVKIQIGTTSKPTDAEVSLRLSARFQHYNPKPDATQKDFYDRNIFSPKSALVLNNKLYINSLEGYKTVVYDLATLKREAVIKHEFKEKDSSLFKNTYFLDYKFQSRKKNLNIFKGKPVEMTTSHNGKYLWVTYYRRNYDNNAIDPSAVAIISTETNKIVRVMPTAPLPKMIASSPNNKYIAITNWGDNTAHIIDISSNNFNNFKYTDHIIVGKKLSYEPSEEKVNRDSNCGYCLRGTTFTPNSKYLLISRMGGSGGITVYDIEKRKIAKTVMGMKSNVRHLTINNKHLYLSSNATGYVQKTNLNNFISFVENPELKTKNYFNWESTYVGKGARTIVTSNDGKYTFATSNNDSRISVIKNETMRVIASIEADSYPVGMAINNDDTKLIVTSQGKGGEGGNSVMIFDIRKKQPE